MNKLYAAVIFVGFINLVILIVGLMIVHEFKEFEDLCNIWRGMKKLDQESYKLINERYLTMEDMYKKQYHVFELMDQHFNALSAQYREIQELHRSYVQLCRDCVSQYSDSYEQFKLCSDKLDKILPPQVSVSPEDFETDNEDIVI